MMAPMLYTHCIYYLTNITFQLPAIEKKMKESNHTILTPLVSLDTPGKSTVEVVILGDPVSKSNNVLQLGKRIYSTH